MQYKITIFDGLTPHNPVPEWDILPVAKLTQPGPGVPQGFFSQAALCYQPGLGVLARMWAFEVAPARGEAQADGTSRLALAIAPNPKRPEDYLSLAFEPDGTLTAYTVINQNSPLPIADTGMFAFTTFKGGDLQGEYWGGTFILPQQLLTVVFGCTPYQSGDCIHGNLLHTGIINQTRELMTLFPISSATPEFNDPRQFGKFEFIHF